MRRSQVTRDWRKLRSVELHDLCSSPNTIRVIKSWKVRWVERVAFMGRIYIRDEFWLGKPERKETTCKTLA